MDMRHILSFCHSTLIRATLLHRIQVSDTTAGHLCEWNIPGPGKYRIWRKCAFRGYVCECTIACAVDEAWMCCSVLQCVAVCCSVLQCVAVCCIVLQWWICIHVYGQVCRRRRIDMWCRWRYTAARGRRSSLIDVNADEFLVKVVTNWVVDHWWWHGVCVMLRHEGCRAPTWHTCRGPYLTYLLMNFLWKSLRMVSLMNVFLLAGSVLAWYVPPPQKKSHFELCRWWTSFKTCDMTQWWWLKTEEVMILRCYELHNKRFMNPIRIVSHEPQMYKWWLLKTEDVVILANDELHNRWVTNPTRIVSHEPQIYKW